jgi:hypothetical protein
MAKTKVAKTKVARTKLARTSWPGPGWPGPGRPAQRAGRGTDDRRGARLPDRVAGPE